MSGDTFLLLVVAGAALLLLTTAQSVNRCDNILDFEDSRQQNCFVVVTSSRGTKSVSNFVAKNGVKSLKLESHASGTSKFRYTRPSGSPIQGKALLRGGIKMWIYKTTAAVNGEKMKVRLRDTIRSKRVGTFNVDMGFKGWRGIWVSHGECKAQRNSLNKGAITTVDFVFKHQDTIYIDLLEFVPNLAFQSRDKIVPPFIKFGSKYNYRDFWQQSYRWSKKTPSATPTTVDPAKTSSIAHINRRLRNWYCDEMTTTYDFTGTLTKRWKALKKSIDDAQKEYNRLEFNPSGTIIGPPLFCLRCTKGSRKYLQNDRPRKFSFIMSKILQPLAIELHLKSRPDEIARTVTEETSKLNMPRNKMALVRICGKFKARQDEFHKHLMAQKKPYTCAKVRRSLEHINEKRLQRIVKVLDYLKDQGWADGSALGSLYMETLRSSTGFIHSLFLLKDILGRAVAYKPRLINFINTAKWYHDFGEIYQSSFEYKGTTADFMITRMLSRLIVVLAMPSGTVPEQKARQRDMDALKRWMENALTINQALGGVIKPDYTGFHHMTFYASAYIPAALHTAAQVQYLLEGTNFELSVQAKRNLLEGLKTLRVTAVKYSTPSSVGGRFPDYTRAVLASEIPAYAYISVSYPRPLLRTPVKGMHISDLNGNAGIFERLYQPSNAVVARKLTSGRIHGGKSYFNTLGSLQLMNKVHSLATSTSVSAESSPEGHWTKNFAALSIHRRKGWVVTVKGFNKFVWDFAANPTENPNGIFASHGSMLIANSEEALKAHDVNAGWDWTKIPGTTAMSLTASERKSTKDRNYSPLSSAGGVTFQGPETLSNGIFAMDFHQPDYDFLNRHAFTNIKLYFKKSVFFYRNLLVCLGSNIRMVRGTGKKVQTTLFQDKLIRGSSTFFIKVDGVRKDNTATFSAMTPSSKHGASTYTILEDTKRNSYYIPSSSASSLKVHVQNQISENVKGEQSSGAYATAWLEHSSVDGRYEYAIYMTTPSCPDTAEIAWRLQQATKKLYEVLKQDGEAHVVKFPMALDPWRIINPLYGYAVFQPTRTLPGPVSQVNKKCRIVVVDSRTELYLSISYPDLDFNTRKTLHTLKDVGAREMFHMVSKENEVQVILATYVDKTFPPPVVHGSPPGYVPRVRVESTSSSSLSNKGNRIVFVNLKNGFSVEIKLRK